MRIFPVKNRCPYFLSLFCPTPDTLSIFILILRKFTAHIDKGSVGEDDVGRDRFFLGNLETELT